MGYFKMNINIVEGISADPGCINNNSGVYSIMILTVLIDCFEKKHGNDVQTRSTFPHKYTPAV